MNEGCCDGENPIEKRSLRPSYWIVVAIALALVIAGFGLSRSDLEVEQSARSAMTAAPTLTAIAMAPSTTGSLVPAAGASISIFSVVPSSLQTVGTISLADVNQTDNPYFVDVFDGTTNGSGVVSGQLSSLFPAIQNSWRSVVTPITNQVSLLVQGTYSVQNGNAIDVYHYFNNIPYNPRENFTAIQITIDFDTSNPSAVIANTASGLSTACIAGQNNCICLDGHCCPVYEDYAWDTVNETSKTGPYPIVWGNDSARSLHYDSLDVAGTYLYSKLQFGFNSGQGTKSASGSIAFYMSSQTSWNGSTTSGSYQIGSADGNSSSSASAGVIFMNNVTLEIINQNEYLDKYGFYGSGGSCGEDVSFVENATTIEVTDLVASSYGFHGESADANWSAIIQHFLHVKPIPMFSNYTLNPTDTVTFLNAEYNATGYVSTANALQTAENWASYFVASLGAALVIMNVAGICGWFCGNVAVNVATATAILSAVAGWALTFLTAINSVSVSFVDTYSFQADAFTNDASGNPSQQSAFNMFFYMSLNSTSLSGVAGGYSSNLPLIEGIACPPNTYPGHGC